MTNLDDSNNEGLPKYAETLIALLVLVVALGFNLWYLYPEVMTGSLAINDSVFHLLLAGSAAEALSNGKDITDPWQNTMSLGFPVFHYYQHLPHIIVAVIHVSTFQLVPLIEVIRWTTYLLLSVFPLSIFWSLRQFGFKPLIAAMGGLLASLIGTDFIGTNFDGFVAGVFRSWGGFGYSNYIFQGWGLYSQLWAMVLLPPALAAGYRVLTDGRGYLLATSLLAMTLMSQIMYGYMAALTLGAFTLITVIGESNPRLLAGILLVQWKRLATLLLLVLIITSYFLIPSFLDREFFNSHAIYAPAITDSVGHKIAVAGFLNGDLFDWGRFPSFTILVTTGMGICLLRWREKRYLIPVAIFFLWFLLFFGRTTWGYLIDVLPLSQYLHMHRFIGGVHLGGILLAAIALGTVWRCSVSQERLWPIGAALAASVLLLSPLYIERRSYLAQNSVVVKQSQQDMTAEYPDLKELVETLKELPPGRVFAGTIGRPGAWGATYRVNCPEIRDNCIQIHALLQSEGLDMLSHTFHGYSLSSNILIDFDETQWEHYNLFNVRYVVAPEQQSVPAFTRFLGQFGRHKLYEVDTTGYFDLVGSELIFSGEGIHFNSAMSSWLASGLSNAKRHPQVLIDSRLPNEGVTIPLNRAPQIISETQVSTGLSRGEIISETVGSDFVAAEVNVLQNSLLMLKTSYHPNWRATVNGVKAKSSMIMPGFTGVQLAPGTHDVLLEYRPRKLRKILLVAGILTLFCIPIGERRGRGFSRWFESHVSTKLPAPANRNTRADRRRRR